MRKLAAYSIETDHTVRLDFADGQRLRVPVTKLGLYLYAPDRERVERGVKLRRQFLTRHMPKVLIGLATASLLATAVVTPKTVDRLISPQAVPVSVPAQSVQTRASRLQTPAVVASSSHLPNASTQTSPSRQPSQVLHAAIKAPPATKVSQNHVSSDSAQEQTPKPQVSPKANSIKVSLPLPLHMSIPL